MFLQLVLCTFQEIFGEATHNDGVFEGVGSPLLLLIGQLQEPAHIFIVIATPLGGEVVGKKALHEESDRMVVTVETRGKAGL